VESRRMHLREHDNGNGRLRVGFVASAPAPAPTPFSRRPSPRWLHGAPRRLRRRPAHRRRYRVMTDIPFELLGHRRGEVAVATLFMPRDSLRRQKSLGVFTATLAFHGWK